MRIEASLVLSRAINPTFPEGSLKRTLGPSRSGWGFEASSDVKFPMSEFPDQTNAVTVCVAPKTANPIGWPVSAKRFE